MNKRSIALLKLKHPAGKAANEDSKLRGPLPTVKNIIFAVIDNSVVQGGFGPSRMDEDGWRQILVSRDYGNAGNNLHKAIASFIKKICIKKINDSSLSPLMVSRLIPLNKNLGLRPIGVGEVLRRVMRKVVMSAFSEDVTTVSSDAHSEAAIHAMRIIFQHKNSDTLILIDATNAFNNLNREVLLHKIKFICPEITTYVNNCYSVPARLFDAQA